MSDQASLAQLELGTLPIAGFISFSKFMANNSLCDCELLCSVRSGVLDGSIRDPVKYFSKLLEVEDIAPYLVSSALDRFMGRYTLMGHPQCCEGMDLMAVPPLQAVDPTEDEPLLSPSLVAGGPQIDPPVDSAWVVSQHFCLEDVNDAVQPLVSSPPNIGSCSYFYDI
ncbi:uncharacterized protein LOC131040986 isoform X1 [Cryptomeria japonica]|uniref:uncharacterized protein LOC131040986 isoform X1 n=2 Tax=Cryptomeria japonica TaxID=3369 RepID=UPI0027DA5ABF|nr:uncharacterized protein LOC131040986 isoform X1 [Cryptomeria japonica]